LYYATQTIDGCESDTRFAVEAIIISEPTATITSSTTELTCTETSIVLDGSSSTVSGTPTYSWSTTDGNIVGSTINSTATINQVGTYQLEITDNPNGCTDIATIVITQSGDVPVINIASSSSGLSCTLTSIDLNGTGSIVTGVPSYFWSTSDGNIIGSANTGIITIDSIGTYKLTVTDSENGCSGSRNITIGYNDDVPVVNINPTATELTCAVNSITLDGSGSTVHGTPSYNWTTINGIIQSGTNTSSAIVVASGTYQLQVTDVTSGCSAVKTISISQSADVPVVIINASATELNCATNSITLDGSGSTVLGTPSFNWTTIDGVIQSETNTSTAIIVASGTYQLQVTDITSGCSAVKLIAIGQTGIAVPEQPSEIIGNINPCNDAEEIYSIIEVDGVSYSWDVPSGWTIISGEGTHTITVTVGSSEGIVTVTPSNECGDGVARTLSASVNSAPQINNPGNQSACNSYTLPEIIGINLSGAEAYYTAIGGGGSKYVAGNKISESTVLYIYDLNGLCCSEESFVITINTLEVDLGPDVEICNGDSYTFALATEYESYLWSNGSSEPEYTTSAGGQVSVTVTDINNCEARDTVVLTILNNPALNLGNDTIICNDEGFLLNAGNFESYIWSTGENSGSITIYPGEQQISLTVTDDNGCEASDTLLISECGISILGEITNVFTPNGDSKHDKWIINGIELFPDAKIEVFDRWGRRVFLIDGGYSSENAWDGRFKGKELPMDNYYYVIDLYGDESKVLKGNLTILK